MHLCFNIQACGLFSCRTGLQSKSLCYANEIARNVLTPGDTCLKKLFDLPVSKFVIVRKRNSQTTTSPSIQHPTGPPGISLSPQPVAVLGVGALRGQGDPGALQFSQLVLMASGAVARFHGWQLLSHWEDTTLDDNELCNGEQHHPEQRCDPGTLLSLQHVPLRLEQGSAL